ncbi:MAG TPA: 23S rRNA (guanosine(2251)-2'-O)-methyltransferase RlmB [Steroidobacteraceae bacterium]|nr:23S rRNA (guanosine(2251)-2'-O)-methyltransferase RlmB [Steroidobacteraceae bacterium]
MSEKVYGLHAVRALLTRHVERVTAVTIAEQRGDPRVVEIQALAQKAGIAVKRAPPAAFKTMFGDAVHQGVYVEVLPLAMWREEELIEAIAKRLEAADGQPPFVLVLDGVQDPHNLGACLRTADACGALAVVIPKDRAVQVTPTVRKVAAGAAETTPIAVVTNLARTLRLLKDAGLWIVGADAEAPKLAHETDLSGPIALVMGAEGSGLRQLTRETCDLTVRLPQQGAVESLNVSVASGMLLYEALRQRLTGKKSR